MSKKIDFLTTLTDRGFVADCTNTKGLANLLNEENSVPAYIGFDCTAESLHVGSLLQIMTLRWYQKSGHKPIVLMGGGTTKVGDPSGKDESRKLLTDADISKNMDGIKQVFEKFLSFEDNFDKNSTNAYMVNNAEWLDSLNYIAFLRDYGRFFSVNKMLSRESVKIRLERESHLSFLEFNYMILQAYDFVELKEKYGCRLQIGGSDQWGNIVGGTELYHHANSSNDDKKTDSLFGLTTPLLTTSSGAKMGKTANGAIWLNENLLSSYEYWQFWRNTEDADVVKFLKLFTELSLEEIDVLSKLEGAEINKAKVILANEATALLHGEDAAKNAEKAALAAFESGGLNENLPTVEIDKSELNSGIPLFKLLQLAKLSQTGGEARRLVKGGGARINDLQILNAEEQINTSHINKDGVIKISSGKKKHVIGKITA